tara:strand:- start:362 stop:583 length:222 start_codon:yes stop_codon:yes gene_type:complete
MPKYKRTGKSWSIKKYNEAKKPKCIVIPDINQIKFLCKKGLLTGKLIMRKTNPKYIMTQRPIKALFKPGKEQR